MTTRILHFIDTLGAGGAERQLVYLLQNLPREQYEPHVLTTYDSFRHYEPLLRTLNIPIYSLHHGALNVQNRASAVLRYIRLLQALRPDIVQSWLHYPNLIACAARPFCPRHRLITSVRTELTDRQRLTEKLLERQVDLRIVNNPISKKQDHTSKQISTIVENAIARDFFQALEKSSNPSDFTTLVVARIDPQKDHLTLLKALHTLKNRLPPGFKTTLLGDVTNTAAQTRIDEAISQFELHKIVQQPAPTHDVIPYYESATVTILPSTSEGFPNAILESLATGTPVITSQAANRSGLIVSKQNGWVFATGDSDALANCIEAAWTQSPETYLHMSAACRETAAPYTIERMVGQYESVYERLLTRS